MLGGVQSSFGKAPLPNFYFFTFNAKILIARRVIIHLIRYHDTREGGSLKRGKRFVEKEVLILCKKVRKKPR